MSDVEATKNNLGGEIICEDILMSKLGKKAILLPKESSVKVDGRLIIGFRSKKCS